MLIAPKKSTEMRDTKIIGSLLVEMLVRKGTHHQRRCDLRRLIRQEDCDY